MPQTKLDDVTLVRPLWLVLRALRGPVLAVVAGCLFVDVYGLPTVGPSPRSGGGYREADYGAIVRFRELDRPAAQVAAEWVRNQIR